MTLEEFSNEFDVLINSAGAKLSLDEYEKSIFLTQAQELLVTSYYNGINSQKISFESSEEAREYLK